MNEIRIFSPATVANVSCGFDTLGLALNTVGDEMLFRKTKVKGISITNIQGADLPYDVDKNVAGVVAKSMLDNVKATFGLEIEIFKKVKPGSGLGSSASSAAGTAFALNELLGRPFSKLALTTFATLGEEVACGSPIADNVGAVLYGGVILVRSYEPLEIVKLPVPTDLWVAVIHPQIEIKTEDARNILAPEITIEKAIRQSANLAGFVSALYNNDYELLSRSLIDEIAEPFRKKLIPHYDELKNNCIKNKALGVGISGSGPSVFSLCKSQEKAHEIASIMQQVYQPTGIAFNIYTSAINTEGVKILNRY